MKVIVVLALLIAAVVAENFCVNLVKDDKSCDGFRTNWPAKVCNNQNADFSSASVCDAGGVVDFYSIWNGLCPSKNVGNKTWCEGTGYGFAYVPYTAPCFYINACTTNADCNPVDPPVNPAPVAVPPPFCFDCCQFCFDDTYCNDKASKNDTYTKSSTCTPCKPADPVAAPTTGSTTPSTTNAPGKKNTGAVVVVSGVILAFSVLLF